MTESSKYEGGYQLMGLLCGNRDCSDVWVVVGMDQAQAAAECHPEGVAIYGLDKRALRALSAVTEFEAFEDKNVLIFPLGDAATDHTVFERSTALGRRCEDEGAEKVEFVWLGADLDAHLRGRDGNRGLQRLRKVVERRGRKPAKAKPKGPSASEQKVATELAELESTALEEARPVVDVNEDRLVVLNKLVDALRNGCDSEKIFSFGGRLARTVEDPDGGAAIAEILNDKNSQGLLNLLSRSTQMISVTQRGVSAAWPESKTLSALYGRHSDFRTLRGIAPSPIVRSDHTIAATEGYDEESRMLIDLGNLEVKIPDAPTPDEVNDAVELLMDDWLGDFPFASDTDKANMLGLILTYPLRELVTLLPLAVISAKSMGTGKSKLVSLVVRLFTGCDPEMDSLPTTEEETRKQITTLLQKAMAFLVFDESPEIGGKSINRLLTASVWSDRILGGNERASVPNRAVKVATGNNVEILGDTVRRYYPIELFYDGEDPQDRPQSEFRHADIESWTDDNRSRLITAVFTLIQAWQVAGRPKRATSFGSFERWEAVVGGVIENAGVHGFLGNLTEHRKSVDFEAGQWTAHCAWLLDNFPNGEFTTRKVLDAMTTKDKSRVVLREGADHPPGVDASLDDPMYAAKLGKTYHSRHGGWHGGYRISKADSKAGGNQTKWIVEATETVKRKKSEYEAAVMRSQQTVPQLKIRLAKAEEEHGQSSTIAEDARLSLEIAELIDRLHSTTWGEKSSPTTAAQHKARVIGKDPHSAPQNHLSDETVTPSEQDLP